MKKIIYQTIRGATLSFLFWGVYFILARITLTMDLGDSYKIYPPELDLLPLKIFVLGGGASFLLYAISLISPESMKGKLSKFIDPILFLILGTFFVSFVWNGFVFDRLRMYIGASFLAKENLNQIIALVLTLVPALELLRHQTDKEKTGNFVSSLIAFQLFVGLVFFVFHLTFLPKIHRAALLLVLVLVAPVIRFLLAKTYLWVESKTIVYRKLVWSVKIGFTALIFVFLAGQTLMSNKRESGSSSPVQKKTAVYAPGHSLKLKVDAMNGLQTSILRDSGDTMNKNIKKGDKLNFSYAIADENGPSELPREVEFTVTAKIQNGKQKKIFSNTLIIKPGESNPGWQNKTINLASFRGKKCTFNFSASTGSLWGGVRITNNKRGPRERNVIFISLDTLRADRLGISGYYRDTSPHIDKLARKSVYFQNAISQAPWTTPSHMSVFTGLYPSFHGVNKPLSANPQVLSKKHTTLAEILQKNGYKNQAFTGSGAMSANFGFSRGFDQYFELEPNADDDAKLIFGHGFKWLEDNKDEKFFLFLHTYEIHTPFYHTYFVDKLGPDISNHEEINALYDAGIRYTDAYIGRLMDKLKELNLLENTLVVIFSDHGEDLYERYTMEHGHTLHDELIRIPIIFHFPSFVPKIHENFQAQQIDIMPTVLSFLDIPTDNLNLQGKSLLPIINGKEPPLENFAISEAIFYGPESKSIRYLGKHAACKYIHTPEMPARFIVFPPVTSGLKDDHDYAYRGTPWVDMIRQSGPDRFFDLNVDPGELKNIFHQGHPYKGTLKQKMIMYLESAPEQQSLENEQAEMDEDLKEKLKSLGYL